MCLAIPMKITEINGHVARCISRGIEREINCFMLQDDPIAVGDFVMVHVGYAIQKVDATHAQLAWATDNALQTLPADHDNA